VGCQLPSAPRRSPQRRGELRRTALLVEEDNGDCDVRRKGFLCDKQRERKDSDCAERLKRMYILDAMQKRDAEQEQEREGDGRQNGALL